MSDLAKAKFSAGWTEPEKWAWEKIAAGEPADFNARDRRYYIGFNVLDPCNENGWTENRRLRVKFLRDILTRKVFADATPYGGVRILGALVDDAPLNLEHARLERLIWLEHSRILTDVKCRSLRVDGDFSLDGNFVGGEVSLNAVELSGSLSLAGATFKTNKAIDLIAADIGIILNLERATFEGNVDLNSAKVGGSAFLRNGATFKAKVLLALASIGSNLEMDGSTFEGEVSLDSAKVDGSALLRGEFKAEVSLVAADIGSDLDFSGASFTHRVDMTGCEVKDEFRLGSSRHPRARWKQDASLVLRNAHVGALQDWWRKPPGQSWWRRWWGKVAAFFRRRALGASLAENSWPKALELEGFTFDRLGGLYGTGKEADMMARPSSCYVEWLGRDSSSSPQPYEHLASLFRRAGEPGKANDLLYEARERRRRAALSKVGTRGHRWEVFEGVGLWFLRSTIGYGLGNRYFRVLRWVGGWSLLGMFVLILFGTQSPALWSWLNLFFASLDQLLPIITLNKAYDVLIFGDPSAKLDPQPPWVLPQPFWVQVYFYVHMMVGWVLGSFIVAGLAGLTQRN
jgi:hypothetical protein